MGLILGGLLMLSGLIADLVLLCFWRRQNWTARVTRLRGLPWEWVDAALVLCSLVVAYTASIAFLRLLGSRLAPADDLRLPVLVQSLLFYGLAVATLMFLMRAKRLSWISTFGLRRHRLLRRLGQAVFFYLAALPPVAVLGVLWRTLLVCLDFQVDAQLAIRLFTQPYPVWFRVYLLVLAVSAAPVIEEMLFRGVALPLLARRLSTGTAVCVVSLLFAAVHFHLPSLIPLCVIASAFSLAYIYSGSIIVPIAMHSLFNTVNLAVLFLLKDWPEMGGPGQAIAIMFSPLS